MVTANGTVTGSASKGIIRNAVVTMSQRNSSGDMVPIGSGTTDSDGEYSVNYTGYTGGLVLVCTRARRSTDTIATPKTTVVCDATDGTACGPAPAGGVSVGDTNSNLIYDLGEAIPAPSDFEICTCLLEPPAKGISAPITPFTDLVVRRAKQRAADAALAEDARTALLNAASEINQLLGGLDVLRLEPINLADPDDVKDATPTELVYSALLAAVIGRVANDSGTSTSPLNLQAIIESLATAADGGKIGLGDFKELLKEAQEQLLGVGVVSDQSGVFATLQAQVDKCEADNCSSFNPEPNANANSNGIARAKNLIGNVRDTINGVQEMEVPGKIFENQVHLAQAVLDPIGGPSDDLFEDLGFALDQASLFVTQQTNVETQSTTDSEMTINSTNDSGNSQTAKVIISTSGVNKVVTINGTVKDLLINNLALTLSDNPGRTTANPLTGSLSGNMETTRIGTSTGLRLTINTGTASLTKTGNVALDDSNPTTDDGKRVASVTFDLNGTLAQIGDAQDGGPVSFTGALGSTIVRCTAESCIRRESAIPSSDPYADPYANDATFFPSALNLSGTFSNTQNSIAMSVVVSVANAASFDPEFNAFEPERTCTYNYDPTYYYYTGQTCVETRTSTSFPEATVTLQFDATLGSVAPARAVLTGSLTGIFVQPETCPGCPTNATQVDPNATATLTLLRGAPLAQVFRIQANTVDNGNNTDVVTTITDSSNASITLDFPDDNAVAVTPTVTTYPNAIGIVRVDGVKVGVIQELSTGLTIIRYDDGTFETLG